MATWTKSELSANVLSALGVKPAGQAAAAEDDILVQGIIDSQHEELKVEGLVPFETSAVPEWAQQGMTLSSWLTLGCTSAWDITRPWRRRARPNSKRKSWGNHYTRR